MEVFDLKKLTPIKKTYIRFLNDYMKKESLSAGYVVFIEALSKQKFHSQQELTDFIGCNKAHTSRTLFKLQLKGIVKLSCAKNVIELTEKGKVLVNKLDKIESDFIKSLSKGVTENEKKIFNIVLDKLIANANLMD